ncbi:MAG: helix-turn-helix domain-containing protein [Actinobacteria bacterium]|nr:helix-turn-helix domain-containing protein [Actinomycetota bacterium]
MAERKSSTGTDQARPARLTPLAQASIDPAALKAFAHPLRMTMYSELQRRGAATASQLARALGESSGQTSYHLRQLERHGFVEDDPDHQGGRERWWRAVGFSMTEPALLSDPASSAAVRAVVHQVIAERASALTAWFEAFDPSHDTDSLLSSGTLVLTVAEAEALTAEFSEVLERHSRASHERTPPEDARRYRVHLDVFPLAGQALPPHAVT